MGPRGSPGSFRTCLALRSIPRQLQGHTYVSPHPAFVWALEIQAAGPSTTEPAPQPSGSSSSILCPPTLWDLAGFPLLALNLETPSGYIDIGQHTTPSDFPHIAICVSHGTCPLEGHAGLWSVCVSTAHLSTRNQRYFHSIASATSVGKPEPH